MHELSPFVAVTDSSVNEEMVCSTSNDCDNGGTCHDNVCHCTGKYSGFHCERGQSVILLQWRNTECKIIWLLRQYCFNCPTYGYRIRNCIDSTWRCVSALSTTEVTTKPEWNKVCTSHLYELTLMIRSTIPPFVDMPHESLITDEGFLISKFVFLICISSCIMSGISMFSFSNENVVRS